MADAGSAANLHFHHVDPSTKAFEIQTALGKSPAGSKLPV